MKIERLLSLFLFIAGLGMGGLGLASVLAYPELLAWLLLVGGVICLLFAVLIWVLPNDAVAAQAEDRGPNEPRPRKGARFLVPIGAAAAAVIVFAVAASGGSGGSTREPLAEIQTPVETADPLLAVQEEIQVPADEGQKEITATIYGTDETITLPSGTMVWLPFSENAEKFHSRNDCGNMNSEKASKTTVGEAVENGYSACQNCWDRTNSEPQEATKASLSVDDQIAILEYALEESYGENFRIDKDDNFVTLNVWSDGVVAEATAAKLGNQECLDSWNGMVADIIEAQKMFQQQFKESGNTDIIVVVNVLNDMNTDNILLTVTVGSVILDDVNGINLLGVG